MSRRLPWTLALLAALASMLFWACALWHAVPFQYADGDTATWVWLLRHGVDLFAPPTALSLWRSNYPPLFLWLVAALAPSDEAILRTGALVALGGFLLATAFMGVAVATAAGSRRAGAQAALLFAGTMVASYQAPACIPDALAFALATAGLTLVVRQPRGWPVLAALAFVAALLTKHSVILLAAGSCGWALLRRPRQASLLPLLLTALVGLALWQGKLLAPLLLWSWAPYDAASLLFKLAVWVLPLAFGLAAALLLLRRWQELPATQQQALGPWAAALLLALPWTLSLGRVGSGANYVLELAAATTVLSTVAAARGLGRRLYLAHVVLMLAVSLGSIAHLTVVRLPQLGREMNYTRAALAGVPGPVLAESTWYTTVLGRPPLLMPFLSNQLARRGLWDPAPVTQALRRGEVVRLVLGFSLQDGPSKGQAGRFSEEILATARGHYTLLGRQDEVYIYGPALPP